MARNFKGLVCEEDKRITFIPKMISLEKAHSVVENLKPLGLFYLYEDGVWVGIDNSTGDAWVDEFHSLKKCLNWLLGEDYD